MDGEVVVVVDKVGMALVGGVRPAWERNSVTVDPDLICQ